MEKIRPFLNEDFLLENKVARALYHGYAKDQPIIDYHNHLSPKEIAEDKCFDNITQVWLYGDHYKWRAMRAMGVEESFITGSAPDKEKFQKWAETVPHTIRNPLFHWTHLELKRYFQVDELLNGQTAERIFNHCNEKLQKKEFSSQGLLDMMNVEIVCTTDDPVDSLEFHQSYRIANPKIKMFPAFRPDKAILINSPGYLDYIEKLSSVANLAIQSYDDLINALQDRIDFFDSNGCRISDHGLNKVYSRKHTHEELKKTFSKRINGQALSPEEVEQFISGIMVELGKMYAEKDWVMQLHLGALRNNSSRMMKKSWP